MENVKLLGRYLVLDDIIWLSSSGSEVSFSFGNCTKGEIVLHGDDSAVLPEKAACRARYAVYYDGTLIVLDVMDTREKHIPLPMGQNTRGTVRVIKLSEASQSNLGVSLAGFDGEIRPLERKENTIEFIGDSITCGYAIDGNVTMDFSTQIEDVTKTYGWYVAAMLDADAVYSSFSGFGIVSGYTSDGVKNSLCIVPDYFDKVGFCDFCIPGYDRVNDHPRDFSLFTPEKVVINLGTNDISYCGENAERQSEFREGYVRFLKEVRSHYTAARIYCILGIMGELLNEKVREAVEQYTA